MKRNLLLNGALLIAILLSTNSCRQANSNETDYFEEAVRREAQAYFDTFADRTDWDKLCSFYREDLHFKDITLQLELDSLWKFKRFYQWDQEGATFQKMHPDQKHLILQSLVVEGNMAVGKGHFNPFYYDEVLVAPEWGMEFTIWLRFDEHLKIVEQIDWMEYDPATLENIIVRCREQGIEAIPDWLDLSQKD